ncbi:MAG: hypothetical protein BWY95_01547 [Bacteroidetes bacterium ADurb.BinA104]|nr:MAG: hypothetical protein BWY95_01547 [Bacteroidetes bacterium ADurb.BinA104]
MIAVGSDYNRWRFGVRRLRFRLIIIVIIVNNRLNYHRYRFHTCLYRSLIPGLILQYKVMRFSPGNDFLVVSGNISNYLYILGRAQVVTDVNKFRSKEIVRTIVAAVLDPCRRRSYIPYNRRCSCIRLFPCTIPVFCIEGYGPFLVRQRNTRAVTLGFKGSSPFFKGYPAAPAYSVHGPGEFLYRVENMELCKILIGVFASSVKINVWG